MDVDSDTGDEAQILGEGGAKSVDIRIQSGGTLNILSGKVTDLYRTFSKSGLLVVENGGTLSMTNAAKLSHQTYKHWALLTQLFCLKVEPSISMVVQFWCRWYWYRFIRCRCIHLSNWTNCFKCLRRS